MTKKKATKRTTKKKAAKNTTKKGVGKKTGKTSARRPKATAKKGENGSCFVLMPFKDPFNAYYESIFVPAVESQGLEAIRGDSLFRPSPIMGDIWKWIREAKVLLAELTQKNPNVFYELGLAHAIGKPVVMVAENIDDVPFDLQQLRVLLYDKDDPAWGANLKDDISAAIDETLSSVVEAVPSMFRQHVESQAPVDSEMSIRLAKLERRVAANEAANRRQSSRSPQLTSPRGTINPHFAVQSWDNIHHAAAWALKAQTSGATTEEIWGHLAKCVSPMVADRVLKEAGLKT